jgi:hypothetical protein
MTSTSRLVALIAGLLLSGGAGAQELADLNKPITLDIPGMELPFVTSLQPLGGWPLTFHLLANKPIGLGTLSSGPLPAGEGTKAYVVWADPDGQWSFGCLHGPGATCPPVDETYLEFRPGLTAQGSSGDRLTVKAFLPAPYGSGLYNGNVFDHPIWSLHAGGFGKSSALPGLVVLGDTGAARQFTADPALGIARTGLAWNVAGFIGAVAWTASDRMPFLARTSVTAQMNVPTGLFQPILFVDFGTCVGYGGYPSICPSWKWSIDGVYREGDPTTVIAAWRAIVTTVRAFVLDGPAPDLIGDLNHDGVIDARDALLMTNPVTGSGYKLLSGERVVKFQTVEDYPFPGIMFDFDGDGMVQPPAPAGAGGVVKIPR